MDVTIQAQVLELMKALQEQLRMGLIIITHDLAVIAELCDRVMVMYLGRDVESGPVEQVFQAPKHPYTVALLKLGAGARRRPRPADRGDRRQRAVAAGRAAGMPVPSPLHARHRGGV